MKPGFAIASRRADTMLAPEAVVSISIDREVTTALLANAAGGTREITVPTMPIAGSFYPVRLALQPR